uniref:ATP synthase F0 subunit 6 n=1 Tax=Xylophaga washingtona TaxID=1049057 RepID=UPI002028E06A|nr:ATP synthase F0 subunit 6 [Xylophaga washingtona]UPX88948.1 ATP synthase F0 subunit 6 [Xylophaga washingtona]UPX88960.1 ATP synthase F0 subunit 6 [Xylophaga washingtona]
MSSNLLSHFDFLVGSVSVFPAFICAFSSLFFPIFIFSNMGVFSTLGRIESSVVTGLGMVSGLVRTQRVNYYSGSVHFVFSLVCVVFIFNFMGSLPYLYSLSSHLAVVFCLSFPLWVVFSICVFPQNFYFLFGESFSGDHPLAITVMLLISELVSIFARPFTLTVRMVVNIVIGQVVLSLIGAKVSYLIFLSSFSTYGVFDFFFMSGLLVMMFFVETLVVLIQTGVFSMLLVFYGEDGVLSK